MSTESGAYGVLYTSNPNASSTPAKTLDELLTPDIKFVRVQWTDFINTTRFRVLPTSYFRTLLSNSGVLKEEHARFYITEMFASVNELHKLGYIHRDLKPEARFFHWGGQIHPLIHI